VVVRVAFCMKCSVRKILNNFIVLVWILAECLLLLFSFVCPNSLFLHHGSCNKQEYMKIQVFLDVTPCRLITSDILKELESYIQRTMHRDTWGI